MIEIYQIVWELNIIRHIWYFPIFPTNQDVAIFTFNSRSLTLFFDFFRAEYF